MHFFTSPKIQLLPYCQLILSSHFSSPPYSELGTNWPHSISLPRCLFGETLLTNLISSKTRVKAKKDFLIYKIMLEDSLKAIALLTHLKGFFQMIFTLTRVTFFLQGSVEKCNKLRLAVMLKISFFSPFYC